MKSFKAGKTSYTSQSNLKNQIVMLCDYSLLFFLKKSNYRKEEFVLRDAPPNDRMGG